ncbi:MAG: hypothetical protein ACP5MZ_04440 [Candidatus Micrarchaeia archaeon]
MGTEELTKGPAMSMAACKKRIASCFTRETAAAFIGYLLVIILVFNPVLFHMGSRVPGTGGDSFLNLWEIWWTGYALLNIHTGIYYTYTIFWPIGTNLVYQTISPLTALISLPFQAFGLIYAYNITLIIGMLISAFGMYALAKYVTSNGYAAFMAGLFYAFSASHVAQAYDHMNWIDIGFIPIFLYFLLKAIREDGIYANAFGMGISFVLITFLGGYEKAIMSIMLALLVVILYLLYKTGRHRVIRKNFIFAAVLGIVIALVIGLWGFIPLIHTLLSAHGVSNAQYLNNVTYNEMWSNNLVSFFVPSYYNGVFNPSASLTYFAQVFRPDPTEKIGYIGYVPLLLALYAAYIDIKAKRRRYLLWSAIAIFFAWMSIGPYLQIGGMVTGIPGIYTLYHAIPGLNVIREPGRFMIFGTIGLDVLAAIGIDVIMQKKLIKIFRSESYNNYALVAVAALLFIIGSSGIPYTSSTAGLLSTSVPPSNFYKALSQVNSTFSVLELPVLKNYNSMQPLLSEGLVNYHAALSRKPFVGGYFGRENTTQAISVYNIPLAVQVQNLLNGYGFNYASPVVENYTNQTLLTLYNYHTLVVAIYKPEFTSTQLLGIDNYLGSIFGNPIYNGNTTLAFSTKVAVQAAVYKSIVAYPYPSDWQQVIILFNGTDYDMYLPKYPAPVTVFAPYANETSNASASGRVDVHASFSAIASYPGSSLKVVLRSPTGYVTLGNFTISKNMSSYSFNASLVPGPTGNTLLFIPSEYGNSSTVYIGDIRFSR